MPSKSKRLFVGLPLAEQAVIDSMGKIVNELNSFKQDLKIVKKENYHITLKFLGSVKEETAVKLADSFKKIVPGTGPVAFQLKGLGSFPGSSGSSVIWAGIECDIKPLLELQKLVEYWSASFGFDREKRRFTPHFTLARVKNYSIPDAGLKSLIAENKETLFGEALFRECHLYESFLSESGPRYEIISSIIL